MAAWFFNHKGRLQGPLDQQDVEDRIKEGKLGPDDLLFAEGDTRWTPISEISLFAAALGHGAQGHKAEADAVAHDRTWVLLQRTGKAYKQKGPFTAAELRRLVKTGEARYSDYVWRDGMREWYRLHTFAELIGEGRSGESASSGNAAATATSAPGEVSVITELKNVMEIRYESPSAAELPAGASGPDLVQSKADPRDTQKKIKATRARPPMPTTKVPKDFLWRRLFMAYLRGDPARLGLILVFFVALGAGGFFTYKKLAWRLAKAMPRLTAQLKPQKAKASAPKDPTPAPAPAPAPAKAVAAAATPEPPAAPPPEPKRPPSYVKLSLSRDGTLKVVTDASSHFSSRLEFTGKLGRVLGRNSYHRFLSLGKDREVSLRDLRWPVGFYDIQVQIDDKTDDLDAMVGDTEDLDRKLRAHRKGLTYDFLKERIAFIKTAERLQGQSDALMAILQNASSDRAWKRDYPAWRRSLSKVRQRILDRIGPKSRNNYVLAVKWLEMKDLKRQLGKLGSSLNQESYRTSREGQADARELASQINSLAQESQRISIW